MLAVTAEHAHALGDLPAIHRDPFDRMLIAQAKVEGFTILTRDSNIQQYKAGCRYRLDGLISHFS